MEPSADFDWRLDVRLTRERRRFLPKAATPTIAYRLIVSMGFVTDQRRWIVVVDVFVSIVHFEGMPILTWRITSRQRPRIVGDL